MVNRYKLELTSLQQMILRFLFVKAGILVNQHQIAQALHVSQPAVMKALPGLEKRGFVTVNQDHTSKRWAVGLNRDSRRVLQLKRVDNLKQLYESGLSDFLEKAFAGGTIVLFGSYSRGDDLENSDIDIAIIGRKEKDVALEKYEKVLERKILLQFYESWGKIHKHLKENLCNGIVLIGGVEL
ncbi:MAG TPA: nucleotidyltransferase domain-containing protein [Candidatus Nanoarchaeia archaeon]|nr:nucleotidyltransferase domain-containing protein [Candidatus Nanoarchaeia archaeon]